MFRILLSTLMMFAFLAVATTTGQAHQAFEVSDANADPESFLRYATNGEVIAGVDSGDRHSSETSLHCAETVHCGTAILTVDFFLRPVPPALSVLPIVDWSIRADSLEIDPPPPRQKLRLV